MQNTVQKASALRSQAETERTLMSSEMQAKRDQRKSVLLNQVKTNWWLLRASEDEMTPEDTCSAAKRRLQQSDLCAGYRSQS